MMDNIVLGLNVLDSGGKRVGLAGRVETETIMKDSVFPFEEKAHLVNYGILAGTFNFWNASRTTTAWAAPLAFSWRCVAHWPSVALI